MIPELRPYQISGNDRVQAAARQGARVIVLQSPTGSGKSTAACDLARRATDKGSEVLMIAHRRRLVDQMSERLSEFEINHGIIMEGRGTWRSALVQVASRDTLFASKSTAGLPAAKLVIVDEGRHAVAPEFRRLLANYERQGAYIVLLDATPCMPDGSGLGPWAKAMIVAAKVTDLVRDGFLVPVKCFAPDRTVVRGKIRRGIAGDLVESWKKYAEGLPTVLFHSRVKHSRDSVIEFLAEGIAAAHVDADTPDDVRDAIFDGLAAGTIKVVSNVGILKEGVDIPSLGCCQFFMEPPGRVSYLQGAGRIMRPWPGKKFGVVIDHGGVVLRDGFPDEDTDWPLEGNVNENWQKAGESKERVSYCKKCELLYKGNLECPQCGRMPAKPPRSIFDPPKAEKNGHLLMEVERGGEVGEALREEKIKHWLRCLAVANARNGNFKMASAIYRRKYNEFPAEGFPCLPPWEQMGEKIKVVFPGLGRKEKA